MTALTGHVVVQTHWDREWYFTRERFLARLIRVAAHFVAELDAGRLGRLLLDGQTIAAEDLLEACEPALADRVRALAREGRVIVGPWYVSADEFLVDGECLVRNLERGMAAAAGLGGSQRVGYVPDTFGHISQMPQILRGFGIDNAVLWRGSDHPASEALWRAPDGSVVFAVLLTQGYYQHPLNGADWRAATTAYFRAVAPAATTEHLLLTQGGDHLATAADVAGRIRDFNASQDGLRLHETRLDDYIERVRSESAGLHTLHGELRANGRAFVLPDVLSTRRPLKEANQRAEDRLIGLVEPLLAVTAWTDATYPARYLARTLDLLLQQQPHDSICGCSADAVHAEMATRFTALEERLDALAAMAGAADGAVNDWATPDGAASAEAAAPERPSPFADDGVCTLFNPSPKPFSGWVEAQVFLAGEGPATLSATRPDGGAVEVVVLSHEPHRALVSPIDDFPEHRAGRRFRVAVRTALDGLAFAPLELAPAHPIGQPPEEPASAVVAVENRAYVLAVDDAHGTVVLTEAASGRRFPGLFAVESVLDAGDTYNHSPPPRSQASPARIVAAHAHGLCTPCETLTLDLELDQPAGLAPDRSGADAERVRSGGRMTLRLLRGEAMVRGELVWRNLARDHRLRLLLPLPTPVDSTASDGGFAWTMRPVVFARVPDAASRAEAPVSVNPSHSVVAAGPFGFIHRGLQEFEVERTAAGDRLGVTLLRAVGWLSRRDLRTRGVGAGPDVETPDAQCLGEHRFSFALTLDTDPVRLLDRAAAWRRPPTILRGRRRASPPGPALSESRLQVSSLRRVDARTLELRLWNPTAETIPVSIAGWAARAVDLARRPRHDGADGVGPFGIATLLLSRRNGEPA